MRVLVAEFLHADTVCFRTASASMKREGRAMLSAVVADLQSAGFTAGLVLCEDAVTALHAASASTVNSADVLIPASGELPSEAVSGRRHDFDWVLPIAPETSGILANEVKILRAAGLNVVAASDDLIQCFSDKWQTWQFLKAHGIPAVPTRLASAEVLREVPFPNGYVLKPRDGCGGEGTVRRSAGDAPETSVPMPLQPGDDILQSFVSGRSFSVGVLRSIFGGPPVVLRPVQQLTQWNECRPVYTGGIISPQIGNRVTQRLTDIAQEVARVAADVVGYLGIDFILPDESDEPLVLEVNPRFCTSYVGYRRATESNLMRCIFGDQRNVIWKPNAETFRL